MTEDLLKYCVTIHKNLDCIPTAITHSDLNPGVGTIPKSDELL
jgi:hypothetical protein